MGRISCLEKRKHLNFPVNFKQLVDKADYTRFKDRAVWDLSLLFLEGRQWNQVTSNIFSRQRCYWFGKCRRRL